MKKLITIITLITIAILSTTTLVCAKDSIIELPIKKIITKQDKNGEDFKIIIVKVPKVLNGVKYEGSMTVMAFQDTIDMTESIEVDQTLKAIVNIREYQGRETATLISVLE